MDTTHRAISVVCWIPNKHRIASIELALQLFSQERTHGSLAFKGMVQEKQHIQNNSQRKSVCVTIRPLLPHDNFWRHIAALSGNSEILTIGCHIIVIANQYIASFRVNKEVSVVQILIAVASIVKFTEAVCNAEGIIDKILIIVKMDFRKQEQREILVFWGA